MDDSRTRRFAVVASMPGPGARRPVFVQVPTKHARLSARVGAEMACRHGDMGGTRVKGGLTHTRIDALNKSISGAKPKTPPR